MKRNKALKIRIYPNQSQQEQINITLGCARAIFNMMLYEKKQIYEKFKDDKLTLYRHKYKTEKELKQEFPYMQKAESTALQQARIDLSKAYSNFFKSISKQRKGPKMGFPKFKKKKFGSSYRNPNNTNTVDINFEKKKVKLPMLKWINFRDKRTLFPGTIKSATVSKTPTGKYFVSLLFEQEQEKSFDIPQSKTKIVGLDMSLEKFFVDSDGNSPAYERIYRKHEKQLVKRQRQLSKKRKGSNNWNKGWRRVCRVHEKIKNKRKDFTQKLSTELVRNNDIVVVETLSLKGMTKTFKLGKSVMDLGYSDFVNQLNYKGPENCCVVIQADKWFASTKICCICGFKNDAIELSDRKWDCPNCGTKHNRDDNAAKNLKNYALDKIGLGRPDFKLGESKTLVFSANQEDTSL